MLNDDSYRSFGEQDDLGIRSLDDDRHALTETGELEHIENLVFLILVVLKDETLASQIMKPTSISNAYHRNDYPIWRTSVEHVS